MRTVPHVRVASADVIEAVVVILRHVNEDVAGDDGQRFHEHALCAVTRHEEDESVV